MFDNIRVSIKLTVGFVIVALAGAGIGLASYLGMGWMAQAAVEVHRATAIADASMEIKYAVGRDMQMLMELLTAEEEKTLDEGWKEHEGFLKIVDTFTNAITKGGVVEGNTYVASTDKQLLGKLAGTVSLRNTEILPRYKRIYELKKKEFGLLATGEDAGDQLAKVRALIAELDDQADIQSEKLIGILEDVEKLTKDTANAAEQAAKDAQSKATKWMLFVLLAVFVFSLLMGFGLTRSINKPLAQMMAAADGLAEGDVDQRLELGRKDEFGELGRSFSAMIDSMRGKANVAEQIARGNLSVDLELAGDKDVLGQAMIQMRESIEALTSDTHRLVDAAVAGRLDVRSDASRHAGAYRKIVEGMNETLDALLAPVREASAALDRLAHCDLRARCNGQYQGDHAQMTGALNTTAEALEQAIGGVADSVVQINAASSEVASGSQQAAEGAAEQASALEQTSASLEQMSGMTRQSADNAQRARALAESAKDQATDGNRVMRGMVDSMEQIRAAAEGTAQIIKDINEIALKTNLLALNAAVEAARAGDAGRGFAVVAEEVRNLALRSKDAAQRTEELIARSVKLAVAGGDVSKEVATKLEAIVSANSDVEAIVNEIASGSQEQARGIAQINSAVTQMDNVVQQSAASSEQSASASEELSAQAIELRDMVSRFQLSRQIAGAALRPGGPRLGKMKSLPSARSKGTPEPEKIIPLEHDDDFANF